MKIEMDKVYLLPTQTHEDDFLKNAEMQGLRWSTGVKATEHKNWTRFKEDHCISVMNGKLDGWCNKAWYKNHTSLPIVEWQIGFTKADMQIGQMYKTRNGDVYVWREIDGICYEDDLMHKDLSSFDIIDVYPLSLTPIWTRPETKYRVKTELTKEQAERLGMEFCEVVE